MQGKLEVTELLVAFDLLQFDLLLIVRILNNYKNIFSMTKAGRIIYFLYSLLPCLNGQVCFFEEVGYFPGSVNLWMPYC